MRFKNGTYLRNISRATLACSTVALAACGGGDGGSISNAALGSNLGISCTGLAQLSLPDATVQSVSLVPAGSFLPAQGAATETNMPAFCRVRAKVQPEISLEVWLPQTEWGGRFLGVGNAAFAGAFQGYPQMADGLRRGFAVASTDAGHTGSPIDASWALGSRQRVIDFGDRALHEMTLKGKALTTSFYGRSPNRSYYSGCSTGGRQGLMEAQRYPADYDGIVAGAPANYMVAQQIGHTGRALALFGTPGSALPPAKISLLAKAVVQQCDALDGVSDGILEDPRQCNPDLKKLLCTSGDASDCFTQPQIDAISKIYAGAKNPRTGAQIFPGYMAGGEEGPGGWAFTGSLSGPPASGISWMKYAVFEDQNWDWQTFDYDKQVDLASSNLSALVDATNPDLSAFQRRGGKLIQYHGWSDFNITPRVSIQYADAVRAKHGSATDEFYRLYMAPGMQHCSGGPGANLFGGSSHGKPVVEDRFNDVLSAVIAWVEQGEAPNQLIASRRGAEGTSNQTRKLCPYPKHSVYIGSGSTDSEANFRCQ